MIECKVEEEIKPIDFAIKATTTKGKVEVVIPDGYDYEIENNKLYFITKKKEAIYPKTYEECCRVLNVAVCDLDILDNMLDTSEIIYRKNLDRLLNSFRKLLIYRDAYWKIAGEEMGLGKPWSPDLTDNVNKHCIEFRDCGVCKVTYSYTSRIFAFPTAEMRDAFYENFKSEIEICKELL